MNKDIFEKLASMLVIYLCFFVGIGKAIADSGTNSAPTLTDNSNTEPQDTTSIQQNGVQLNGFNGFNGFSNPLTPPSCNKQLCGFIMLRTTPYGSESGAGIVFQLGGSSEETIAESQKLLAIAQKEKLDQESTLILTEKLAEAIEAKKIERAKLYAISLAKKLGYADYRQLMKDISTP
ncbi:MAG: hypothetical protein RMX68_030350 [Aulosira sp. ZfuVER01]|nr:hypothetical protein [Aulosira sp. ZfuVER01]MDZ7997708.1 hypothetical protein [Aulosira sp. DedVER01a]MDZ8052203.1 hypothetical protein [Aulosira sp. ZfuCHP01]